MVKTRLEKKIDVESVTQLQAKLRTARAPKQLQAIAEQLAELLPRDQLLRTARRLSTPYASRQQKAAASYLMAALDGQTKKTGGAARGSLKSRFIGGNPRGMTARRPIMEDPQSFTDRERELKSLLPKLWKEARQEGLVPVSEADTAQHKQLGSSIAKAKQTLAERRNRTL